MGHCLSSNLEGRLEYYTEKLGYYFLANKIDDVELKRSILLAACGSPTLRLIKSLTELDLKTLPYATIVKLVQDYYEL